MWRNGIWGQSTSLANGLMQSAWHVLLNLCSLMSQVSEFPWFSIGCCSCFWNLLLWTFRDVFFFSACKWVSCRRGVLIAHSWPHFAKSFRALAFKLLATVIVGRKRIKMDSSHLWFSFSSIFLPFTPFLCYIKQNTDIFPLNLDSSHRLSFLRNNQLSLV